jgi:hypothetical protein
MRFMILHQYNVRDRHGKKGHKIKEHNIASWYSLFASFRKEIKY